MLWALGTVLGRYMSREIEFQHILSLRFFFGLIASAIALPIMGASAYSNGHDSVLILYLALVTGLAALTLYYYGLQRTPAVLSSLAELTYPAVAVIAGIYAYDQHLSWTQWLGVALILGTVTLLPVRRRRVVAEQAGASWFRPRRDGLASTPWTCATRRRRARFGRSCAPGSTRTSRRTSAADAAARSGSRIPSCASGAASCTRPATRG